ncbi:TonB-dependent receptor [Pontibacter sp. MBLB2868]|uniref:TonB-dependent receptor n=1 Tax=Pontibacter sp. MBLB2868 TaxID=3451555 RepID=UPI003F7531A9
MKNLLLVSVIMCFCTSLCFGHNGSIKGKVYSKDKNTPLQGATVAVANTDKGATTDAFGIYSLTGLPFGKQTLYISYLGYRTLTQTVDIKEGETLQLNILLEPGLVDLSEVTVNSQKQEALGTISALDVNLRPVQSSQEVLRVIPGLFIGQHAGGGKAEQIFLRGFDIDHGTDIRLTVDGMPVNMVSHAHGQGYSDLHFIIPETIEGVEYGKGPYQADQGNFATAGYASFSTRRSISNSSLKLEGGLYDTYRAVGMFDLLGEAARQKQQHAYVATEYMYTNGYFNSPQNFNRLNLFGRYQGMVGQDKILSLSLSTFRSKWDASGQIPLRAVESGLIDRFGSIDDTEGGATSRQNANLTLTSILPNGATLDNQIYLVNYDFELYSNFTFFLNDPINGDQIRQRESRNIYGQSSTYTQEGSLFNKRITSEAGVEMRYDVVQGSELSRTKGRSITLSEAKKGDIDELNLAAYLSETLELDPKLRLNAALRLDQFMFDYQSLLNIDSTYSRQVNTEYKVSPKVNLFYNHSPALQFYASAGTGFHSNDTRVSVQAGALQVLPTAYGADLGVNYKPIPSLILHAAIWRLDLDQELVYVGDEGIVEPSGKTRRYGLDLSGRCQLATYLFADADANFTKPRAKEEPEGNDYIPLVPLVTGTGGLTLRPEVGLFGSFRVRYLQSRPANQDYSLTARGYTLLDALVGYTFKRIELKLSAENLLNTKWEEAQFDTESRLRGETAPVSEIHFTPGSPTNYRLALIFHL